jgi:hypothetical protein
MILLKGILGGVIAVIVMWVALVSFDTWRTHAALRQKGATGLTAVAGGWNHLLHMPLVVILLAVAFGIGLYVTVR